MNQANKLDNGLAVPLMCMVSVVQLYMYIYIYLTLLVEGNMVHVI